MRLKITITLEDDTGKVSRTSKNEIMLETCIDGMDKAVQKQDFMTQASELLHSISDNQIPALYAAVDDDASQIEDVSDAKKEINNKIKKLKKAKAEEDISGDDAPSA